MNTPASRPPALASHVRVGCPSLHPLQTEDIMKRHRTDSPIGTAFALVALGIAVVAGSFYGWIAGVLAFLLASFLFSPLLK